VLGVLEYNLHEDILRRDTNVRHILYAALSLLFPLNSLSKILWGYRAYSHSSQAQFSRRVRFLFRSFVYYKPSAAWFGFVRDSHLAKHSHLMPELLQQLHRPLYDYRLSAEQRSALLMVHHAATLQIFGAELVGRLLAHEREILCELQGKHGDRFRISLSIEEKLNKEGQLCLSLVDQHEVLISLAFSLNISAQKIKIIVGAIQATHNEALGKIRHVTNECHGIQPRLLLISALRMLSACIDVDTIEAVSTDNHIYKALRYRYKKSISASYDTLWEMVLGEKLSCGNYNIPIPSARKPLEAYPSKKRAEYRHRFELIDEMQKQIDAYFLDGK
jgi:uncharacterized protein VirK/YbjX